MPYLNTSLFFIAWIGVFIPFSLSGYSSGMEIGPIESAFVSIMLVFFIISYILIYRLAIITKNSESSFNYHVIICSLIAIVISASGGEPSVDDDIYRYMWDGFITSTSENPLEHPPLHSQHAFPEEFRQKIAYSNIPTVYPPVSQLIFSFFWSNFKSNIHGWSIGFGLITFLFVLLMLHTAHKHSVPKLITAFLVLNPILYKEFVDSCHIDIFGILFLLLGFLCITTKPNIYYYSLGIIFFTLSCMVKPIAILFLPFIPGMRWQLKASICILTGALSIVIMWWFFGDTGQVLQYFHNISYFQQYWLFNPFLIEYVYFFASIFSDLDNINTWYFTLYIMKSISAGIIILAFISTVISSVDDVMIGTLGLGIFLLSQGSINPWYIFWLWPLVTFLPWSNKPLLCERISKPILLLPLCIACSGYQF